MRDAPIRGERLPWAFLLLGFWACVPPETHAPKTGGTALAVLVSADQAELAHHAAHTLEARLRNLPGVAATHGARGHGRLFFAVRWPLYLPVPELSQLKQVLSADESVDAEALVQQLLTPIALAEWPRANRLYAASMPYASTPDERAIAVWVQTRAGADREVRRALEVLARELGKKVRLAIDDPGAFALLFGATSPLTFDAPDATRAREIVRRLDDLGKRRPDFPIRDAYSIESYLPRNAQAQLIMSQALRALLKTDFVADWPQARRDAVRNLVPLPLTRLPEAQDLPEYLKALFRTSDGKLERRVILLPRPELSPHSAVDRARVAQAVSELAISEPVDGAFFDEVALDRESHSFWLVALGWIAGLTLLTVLSRRTGSRRVRRSLLILTFLTAGAVAGCHGLASLARSSLVARLPQLSLPLLTISPCGQAEAHGAHLTFPGLTVHLPYLQLRLTSFDTIVLIAKNAWLEVDRNFGAHPVHEDIALGDVRIEAPLSAPLRPRTVTTARGDLGLALKRESRAQALSGSLSISPALFGRLPLIARAKQIEGLSLQTSEPQSIRLTSDFKLE